jgi:hypothetical protein
VDDNGEPLTDHGKAVRVKVHAPGKDEIRQARRAAYGNRKSGKLNNETFLRSADRGEAYTREIAIATLDDSENFNIELSGPKAVKRFADLLGPDAKVAQGGEICLDGKWSPEVKRAYFTEFVFSPSEARKISNFADKVTDVEAADEREATADFSRP